MKATIIVIQLNRVWRIYHSVDWEIDRAYWLSGSFREGMDSGIAAVKSLNRTGDRGQWTRLLDYRPLPVKDSIDGSESHHVCHPSQGELFEVTNVARWLEPLPLGLAERVCNNLEQVLVKSGGGMKRGQELELESMESLIRAEIHTLREAQGDNLDFGDSTKGRDSLEILSVAIEDGQGSYDFHQAGEVLARELGRMTPPMQGRALLFEEMEALVADADALPKAGSLLSLLQLGVLLGALRVNASVAYASGRRGLLQQCRRCGSGESRLRRSACASCGQAACAVCEACLTLGRSRGCGILVLGVQASSSHPNNATRSYNRSSVDELCGRWNLSPAQLVAAGSALRFLRSEGDFTKANSPVGQPHNHQPHNHLTPDYNRPGRLRTVLSHILNRASRQKPPAGRSFLLWAVTGAGKTEMIFPLIEAVLEAGGRALIATPRRDVVLELAPRLAKAFPGYEQAVLYGGSEERWKQASLTIATTHQLLRFREAYDLVMIDELDAFPYHNDPMLQYAAAAACKSDGTTMLLSATPPAALQRAVRRGRLPCAKVPVRYHRHPLPVPVLIRITPLRRWGAGRHPLRSTQPPTKLLRFIGQSLARGAQVFVFVPYIAQVDGLVRTLRHFAEQWSISPAELGGTSSKDESRRDKVMAFRECRLRLLVSTTILERGVTIPRSDVFIVDAQNELFEEAALVQMAGRAGRSADDPHGRVYFCGPEHTAAQRGAIRRIRMMNRLARRGGYLIGEGSPS